RLLNGSSAAIVKLITVPATAFVGAASTENCETAAALTVIALVVAEIEGVTVSETLMVCVPTVFNVMLKVPTPAVKALSPGKPFPGVALGSVLTNFKEPQ